MGLKVGSSSVATRRQETGFVMLTFFLLALTAVFILLLGLFFGSRCTSDKTCRSPQRFLVRLVVRSVLRAFQHHDLFQPIVLSSQVGCLAFQIFGSPTQIGNGPFESYRFVFFLCTEASLRGMLIRKGFFSLKLMGLTRGHGIPVSFLLCCIQLYFWRGLRMSHHI